MKKKVVSKYIECGRVVTPFGIASNMCEFKEELWFDTKTLKTRKKARSTRKIAVFSGNILEIKTYSEPVFYNFESKASGRKKHNGVKRVDNVNKAKVNLRRLINSNVDLDNFYNNKFVTFTFSDVSNSYNIDYCKNEFKKFVKRLKYRLGIDLKYCYVVEIQKERMSKYGCKVWHFHVIFFNLPYIDNNLLAKIWGHGFVKINCIENVDNVGAYVVKYMNKDFEEVSELKNLYGRSRGNLNSPIVIMEENVIDIVLSSISDKEVFSKSDTCTVDKDYSSFNSRYFRKNDLNIAFINNFEYELKYEKYYNSNYYYSFKYQQFNFTRAS